jgi:sugar phosphate permease
MDRAGKRTVAYVWLGLGYIAYYLCRQNFAVAVEAGGLINDNGYGWMVTLGTFAYAVGKLVTGAWADKYGGKRIFLVGMVASAAATLPMGLVPSGLAIGALWIANRFFQSMGWGGLVNVAAGWSDSSRYGRDMGFLSVSYQVGGAAALAFAGAILTAGLGWRMVFVIPALVLAGFALVVRWQLEEAPAAPGGEAEKVERAPFATLLVKPAFLVACGLSFLLTLVRECFNSWLPKYFAVLGAGHASAAFKSTVFPLLGALGTITLGWISDKVPTLPRPRLMAIGLVFAAAGLYGLAHLERLSGMLALTPATTATVLVGVVGFFMLGCYAIVAGGALALDFGGRSASATAAGALDGVGYLGGAAAGIGVASLVEQAGWGAMFGTLAAATALGVVLSLVIGHLSREAPKA